MIDFSNFYQLIVKSLLFYWLEMLFVQVVVWQCDVLYGKFCEWECVVEFLLELMFWCLDFLYSVIVESEMLFSEGYQ